VSPDTIQVQYAFYLELGNWAEIFEMIRDQLLMWRTVADSILSSINHLNPADAEITAAPATCTKCNMGEPPEFFGVKSKNGSQKCGLMPGVDAGGRIDKICQATHAFPRGVADSQASHPYAPANSSVLFMNGTKVVREGTDDWKNTVHIWRELPMTNESPIECLSLQPD
jgi:hypothetical protein